MCTFAGREGKTVTRVKKTRGIMKRAKGPSAWEAGEESAAEEGENKLSTGLAQINGLFTYGARRGGTKSRGA